MKAFFSAGILALTLALSTPLAAHADDLKIGLVDLQQAFAESKAGKKARDTLIKEKESKETQLKKDEEELKKMAGELQNMMLSASARAKKEQEVRTRELQLREDVQKAQDQLMKKEREMTGKVFKDIQGLIQEIAKQDKFDLVMEKKAYSIVLFSKFPTTDITEKVIKAYDSK